MREAKRCLVRNEKAKKLGDLIQISHKQPRNMKRIVTANNSRVLKGAQPTPHAGEPGCFKCNKGCKVSCPILREGAGFRSTNTHRTYRIHKRLTCDSSYIVYLATCRKCKGQYVGKSTQTFKKRHSGHKQEIKNKIGGLGHHYGGNGCGYANVSFQVIDQVELGNDHELAECETYWQHQLRCYVENGGNAHCYRKEITRSTNS
jgi:hypothetical protein